MVLTWAGRVATGVDVEGADCSTPPVPLRRVAPTTRIAIEEQSGETFPSPTYAVNLKNSLRLWN